MTIAPDYSELHHAVDRLRPDQAEALYVVVESMLGQPIHPRPAADQASVPTRHRLAFTAAGNGPPDLSERAFERLPA